MTTSAAAAASMSNAGHLIVPSGLHDHDADPHGLAHVMPISILVGVFFALIALTVLTVYSSYFPLGAFELIVAMGIATIKALMVVFYFMHVRYDKPLNGMLVAFSLFFVALFLGITLMDSLSYQNEIEATSTAPTQAGSPR